MLEAWYQVPLFQMQIWEFVEWLGTGIAQPAFAQTTVTMDADRNITARFKPRDFNVIANVDGKGSTTGSGLHPFGSTINITATPEFGYEFSHWEGVGPDSDTSAAEHNSYDSTGARIDRTL